MNHINKIDTVIKYLNDMYNQVPPDYNNVECFDEFTAISYWSCGAIIAIADTLYFINEDDGHYFLSDDNYNCFSSSYIESYINALTKLNSYIHEVGIPYHYISNVTDDGSKILSETICGYALGVNKDLEKY